MLATFVSLFSIFGLAALLGGSLLLARQLMRHETRAVKVPVKVSQDPRDRIR
jgi:nitrate reductase gamma subunit